MINLPPDGSVTDPSGPVAPGRPCPAQAGGLTRGGVVAADREHHRRGGDRVGVPPGGQRRIGRLQVGRPPPTSGTQIAGGAPTGWLPVGGQRGGRLVIGQRGHGGADAGGSGDGGGRVECGGGLGDRRPRRRGQRRPAAPPATDRCPCGLFVAVDDQQVGGDAAGHSTTATTVTMIQVAIPRRPPPDAWRDVMIQLRVLYAMGDRPRHCNQRAFFGWSVRVGMCRRPGDRPGRADRRIRVIPHRARPVGPGFRRNSSRTATRWVEAGRITCNDGTPRPCAGEP